MTTLRQSCGGERAGEKGGRQADETAGRNDVASPLFERDGAGSAGCQPTNPSHRIQGSGRCGDGGACRDFALGGRLPSLLVIDLAAGADSIDPLQITPSRTPMLVAPTSAAYAKDLQHALKSAIGVPPLR